jgi:hypothetical protein
MQIEPVAQDAKENSVAYKIKFKISWSYKLKMQRKIWYNKIFYQHL